MSRLQKDARSTGVTKVTFLLITLLIPKTITVKVCQKLQVKNEVYIKANGIYKINKTLSVNWAKNKPVYQLDSPIDRVIFYNGRLGWCIGKKAYLSTGHHWYKSNVKGDQPIKDNSTWETAFGFSNISINCMPDTEIHQTTESNNSRNQYTINTSARPSKNSTTLIKPKAGLETEYVAIILIFIILPVCLLAFFGYIRKSKEPSTMSFWKYYKLYQIKWPSQNVSEAATLTALDKEKTAKSPDNEL